MNIDRETVLKMAHLARLEVAENEVKGISEDMERILTFIDKLNELDTSEVEPLVYMSHEVGVMRADEVIQSISHEEALLNAPAKDSVFFRVPKVIS